MVELILKSIGLGLLIAVLVGPVFFLLINTSISKGFVQALYLALGISACDASYILVIYLGFAQFTAIPIVAQYMSVGGGLILILFGLFMVLKRQAIKEIEPLEFQNKERFKYFVRGFILNLINPSVCLFWFGTVGVVAARYDNQINYAVLFFTLTIVTVLSTDILKIYLAKKISYYVSPIRLHRINQFSGLAMIVYGIYLLIETIN